MPATRARKGVRTGGDPGRGTSTGAGPGRAVRSLRRPSTRSLSRIAAALGTIRQTLLGPAAGEEQEGPARGAGAALLEVEGGGARLLVHTGA